MRIPAVGAVLGLLLLGAWFLFLSSPDESLPGAPGGEGLPASLGGRSVPGKKGGTPLPLEGTPPEESRGEPVEGGENPLSQGPGRKGEGKGEEAWKSALARVTTPGLSRAERAAAWEELARRGILEEVLEELERKAGQGRLLRLFAEGAAWLGLHQKGDEGKAREWAERADQAYERILGRNPEDWKARLGRAALLTRFPGDRSRRAEGRSRLEALLRWQESRPPRRGFSRAYLLLGEAYLEEGDRDRARRVWRRGLDLFPGDEALRKRLGGR